MFNFGLSSVLGNRDNSAKKTRIITNDDSWYLPYNGPYEEPPRDTTPQRRKQRDSWGDPLPISVPTANLELTADGDILDKTTPRQQYEPRDIKYGVQGVFDDDWKRARSSATSRIGAASDKERGRRVSYGRDQRPSSSGHSEPVKNTFSTTSRRRSTVSSGNSPTIPDYVPLDGISGGVGESPMPQRRAQKDANRISLGSIFTFGARMRMSSPTGSIDDDREGKVDSIDAKPSRPTSNSERDRFLKLATHATLTEKRSLSDTQKNKSSGYYALSNGKEDYHDYYHSLYSTLVADDDNGTSGGHPYLTHHKKNRERHHATSTAYDSRPEKHQSIQPRPRTTSRQNLTVAHPYAPYAHHDRSLKDEKLLSPASDDAPLIRHQKHPYNQAQAVSRLYGQNSVSTGTSSPSHVTSQKRGSGQSDHGGYPQPRLRTNTTAVAPGVVGTGIDGKTLKMSRSTPNFRHDQTNHDLYSAAGPSNAIHQLTPPMPSSRRQLPPQKPKDRWLSAESWCDALLFPRPRLKIKQDKTTTLYSQADESFIGGPAPSGSGRIVSPPESPLGGEWDIEIHGEESQLQSRPRDQKDGVSGEGGVAQKQREPGIPSRVLAHSKSFDVQTRSGKEKEGYTSDIEPRAVRRGKEKTAPVSSDILPPPTSVPDLSQVLSEGRLLDEERQAWQALAVNSFGNKRSRSLSRTRTKSLTRKGRSSMRRKGNTGTEESDEQVGDLERRGQSSFEYLAAQACLGNQNCDLPSPNSDSSNAPTANTSGLSRNDSTGVDNVTQSCHGTHSNLQSTGPRASTTKSGKPRSNPHSRNNSAGNSALQAGHISMSRLCGSVKTAPDLEGALKGQGTKVIRLADPAHIPVDKGLPVSESVSPSPHFIQNQRKTPSPDLSVSNVSDISHSKVGIAIGTPPEEAEGGVPAVGPLAVSASYVPTHPYAQGGLSFSVKTPSSGKEHPVESCRTPPEAHTTAISGSKVPTVSEILTRHKVSAHPYALISGNTVEDQSLQSPSRFGIKDARDSYLDANGLIGRYRTDDRHPDPSRMWAQLSPDIVREILPDDLQYSPYDADARGIEKLEGTGRILGLHNEGQRMRSIHDTAGVAEALLRYERDRNTEEIHIDDDRTVKQISEKTQSDQPDLLVVLNDLRKPSHASSAHTIASSHLDLPAKSPSTHVESLDHLETASSVPTSGSPRAAFRPLGSPNDLDSYQDLFYQPSTTDQSPVSHDGTAHVVSWDAAVRNRRTGSSLTSLARQLGEEYEALASVNASRSSSVYRSRSLGAQPHLSGISGLSADGNLQFVLEEMASPDPPHRIPNVHGTVHAFESANLPEDVYSVKTSSIMDGNGEDDDPTGLLRIGVVESLSTPAAVDVEHRISFNGETIFDYEDQDATVTQSRTAAQPGLASQISEHSTDAERTGRTVMGRELLTIGLASQRPLTQLTQSSYMTTSDLSRMSGLSDFPAPPKSLYSEHHDSTLATPTPRHLSVFNTYFEGEPKGTLQPSTSFTESVYVKHPGSESSGSPAIASHGLEPRVGRVEFGVNQSAAELAKSLSSPGL